MASAVDQYETFAWHTGEKEVAARMQQKKLEMEKALAKGGAIDMDDYDDLYQVARGHYAIKCRPPSARSCSITPITVYIFEHVPMEVGT
jgi:hypothetical protein